MKPEKKTLVFETASSRFTVTARDFEDTSEIVVQHDGPRTRSEIDAFNRWMRPMQKELITKPTVVVLPHSKLLVWPEENGFKFLAFDLHPDCAVFK